MANYIKVDHSKFENAANSMDTYVRTHKNKMSSANAEVTTLAGGWSGDDFNQFRTQWNKVDDKGSTSDKMICAMENYANFLRFAANKYKEAQTDAVNRANGIPRW